MTLRSPLQGLVARIEVSAGGAVVRGQVVVVVESMKMEHDVPTDHSGVVTTVHVAVGDQVRPGDALVSLLPRHGSTERSDTRAGRATPGGPGSDADGETGAGRTDDDTQVGPAPTALGASRGAGALLSEVLARHAVGLDAQRPDAVARRRRTGQRTARENVADLCDDGSFVEYGPLAIAAQRRRRNVEELIERTPADGMVGGLGRVDGRPTVVVSYDYTVLAGTQGFQNHRKKDRLFELAERQQLPVVLFAEGGGGRPGDVDAPGVSGLDVLAFQLFAKLSGRVPLVGLASGRCFAGNAALLGCCDVVIATDGSNIGMGGPAMIEGGGLGAFSPEDIGPLPVQVANGVVDLAVTDEAAAVAAAKKYLSYFAGPAPADAWQAPDVEALRTVVPEQRNRLYEVRDAVSGIADVDSVLELRAGWGRGIVTALARVEGRPLGVIANDPAHLGGALDPDGCDKAARFLTLCDAFDLPVLFLCDTPGFMVGPDIEAAGMVRHAARLFTVGANVSIPTMTVILRKAYGLGAQAMAGGTLKAPLFCVAWPTGEVGGMGLEGAVRLGFRKELDAITDPDERDERFRAMVALAYDFGKALNSASHFEIDDVIDPADTRRWIAATLVASPPPPYRSTKKRPNVDSW